jgi:hypothetical protein
MNLKQFTGLGLKTYFLSYLYDLKFTNNFVLEIPSSQNSSSRFLPPNLKLEQL